MATTNAEEKGLRPLEELVRTEPSGRSGRWRPSRMSRRLLDSEGEIPAREIPELLLRLLYGPGRVGESLAARFGGPRPIEVRRDGQDRAAILLGDRPVDLGGRSPGEILFGQSAARLRDEIVVDGREVAPGAGAAALRDALRAHLELPAFETADSGRQAEDLEALRRRRRLLERELAELPDLAGVAPALVDPPAVGEILESLEATREVERRILARRIDLAEALDRLLKRPASEFASPSRAVLDQLEGVADELEAERAALDRLRRPGQHGAPFWARALTMLLTLVAALAALAGRSLDEPALTTLGLAVAGLAVASFGLVWFGRLRGLLATTHRARRMRAGRQRLRERARGLLLRLGAMADPEDLTPESIRDLIDRVARRDQVRVLKETISAFVDGPAELGLVRKLHRALETPLGRAAEVIDPKTPPVPLVRLTRSALGLAAEWNRALEESRRRIEEAVERRVRVQIEREMIEEGLEKLRATERTLELAAGAAPRGLEHAGEKAARRLEARLLPLLRRRLGERAPRGFRADLLPVFDREPDAGLNAFIMLVAILVDLRESSALRESLGRFLIDPNLLLDEELERALADTLAELPQAGTLNLVFRRPGLEESFRQAAAALVPALIGDEATGVTPAAPLYSGHAADRGLAPAPPHVLL